MPELHKGQLSAAIGSTAVLQLTFTLPSAATMMQGRHISPPNLRQLTPGSAHLESAWGCDDNMGAARQCPRLLLHVQPSNDDALLQPMQQQLSIALVLSAMLAVVLQWDIGASLGT